MNELVNISPSARTAIYSGIGAISAYLITNKKYPDATVPAVIFGQMAGTILAEIQNQKNRNNV